MNSNEVVKKDEVVPLMNLENLKLALYIISNLTSQSKEAREKFLQDSLGETKEGKHFLVLLGW